MKGWLLAEAPTEVTSFAGGIRPVYIGSMIFAFGFAVLAMLAFRAELAQGIVVAFAMMAGGNALSALGLMTRAAWGARFGICWHFIALVVWLVAILCAGGIAAQPLTLILIGIALVWCALFHMGAAIYLAYGRRPNLRYRNRIPDPRYWGPYWVGVSKSDAAAHPLGRFGGKLWILLGLVTLSALGEATGVWVSPGWSQIIGVALHVYFIVSLLLRWKIAFFLAFGWSGVSFLRGVTMTALAEYSDHLFWPLIIAGPLTAILSIWVMVYFAKAVRPNLVYAKRYRRLLDGEVY